ncbi:MAG TPA: response regulator, partial [Gemmataceae bacterium]
MTGSPRRAACPPPGRHPRLPPRTDPVRVLLVEDHKPLVRALRQGLEEEGYAVDVAYDGEEADYKVGTVQYDVIVLDIML